MISDFREELLETPKLKTFNDKETPIFNSVSLYLQDNRMISETPIFFGQKKHGFLWPFPEKPTPASILRRSTSFDYKDAAEINAPVGRASGVSEKKAQRWMVCWMGLREHQNWKPLIWWGKSMVSPRIFHANHSSEWPFQVMFHLLKSHENMEDREAQTMNKL